MQIKREKKIRSLVLEIPCAFFIALQIRQVMSQSFFVACKQIDYEAYSFFSPNTTYNYV